MKAARIVDGILHDVAEIPEGFEVKDCFVAGTGFVEVPDDAVTGMTYKNGKVGPVPKPEEPKWTTETLRRARDQALRGSDWSQLPDVPEETRKKYAEYRQELRDLPSKFPDPANARLPEPPEGEPK